MWTTMESCMATTGGWALWLGTPADLASCCWEAQPDRASLTAYGLQNQRVSVSIHHAQGLESFPSPLDQLLLSRKLSGMCWQGRIEVSERELNGTCNSTCANKSYYGLPKLGCTRIDNCQKKETGWKRFFAHCVPCICDCAISCRESLPRRAVKYKRMPFLS